MRTKGSADSSHPGIPQGKGQVLHLWDWAYPFLLMGYVALLIISSFLVSEAGLCALFVNKSVNAQEAQLVPACCPHGSNLQGPNC